MVGLSFADGSIKGVYYLLRELHGHFKTFSEPEYYLGTYRLDYASVFMVIRIVMNPIVQIDLQHQIASVHLVLVARITPQ